MKVLLRLLVIAAAVAIAALPIAAAQEVKAHCDGYQVVSSQSSHGAATFRAKVDRTAQTIEYQLDYNNLDGDIIQSHIHFSRPGSNGGIVLFLCTNLGNTPPSATPAPLCPGTRDGSVSGTLHAGDVVYVPFGNQFPPPPNGTQGISPGDFDAIARAIDAGAAYVVVHTKAVPTGELRGQIPGRDDQAEVRH